MLQATLNIKHNINIKNYSKLIAFLKRKNDGHVPKKSKTLEIEQVEKFIREAPDEDYLLMKTVLIIGMCAACRREELTKMTIEDIQDRGDVLIITIPDNKTKKPRTSCMTEPTWIKIIQKYKHLRPPLVQTQRFFVLFRK
ncbi:hypothetical protein RN001_001573 [Aquatica leii]|uniref:Tyr recombinase domain-containing protein n=1 Tax=Aquatica leii TaxID=1421715 RepID=A0AAN7SJM7_9COLE|nr:hypothetical protein RN001_001573 [Aquatica leii]